MSRSNPNDVNTPNPATRWFEWNGDDEHGTVRYYDKEKKENIDVGSKFQFILLDQLGCVRGWHDASDSGIYSNEVKDTRQDVLVVKSFKGGTIAEGLYKDIKDRVNAAGGQFVSNCYIAYKNGKDLALGSIRFKGAALRAWMEFSKTNRAELYKKAVMIAGYTEGKKGRITFRVPVFKLVDITSESDKVAKALDMELQAFLDGYLKRTKGEQVEAQRHELEPEDDSGSYLPDEPVDDIPDVPLSAYEDDEIGGWA